MELLTERLKLNPVTADDLEEVHRLHAAPEVAEFTTRPAPETIEDTKLVIQGWIDKQKAIVPEAYVFSIRLIDTDQFIGVIGLSIGMAKYRNADVGFTILPEHWGRGYTTEALKRVIHFCFSELRLHRIEAGCATGNIGSVRVLEKAGMTREGCKRNALPVRGQWLDSYFYAILESDGV